MAINKLTNEEINAVKVEGRGNPLTGGVAANQAVFDALPKKVNGKLNEVIDEVNAAVASASAHFANKGNPHGVTKAQVGLGNVDNTSDLNKPVSNAVEAELGKKADKVTVDTALDLKADKFAVDAELDLKADKSAMDAALSAKADKAELDKKADAMTANGGFKGGIRARSDTSGAAVGADSYAVYGGLAGGNKSKTNSGLAGGSEAHSLNGLAGGKQAITGAGVAAGEGAQTVDANGNPIDAIQLGTGVNKNPKTMQVYEHPVFDANTGKLFESVIPDSVAKAEELETKADKAELSLKADKSELEGLVTQAELDEALLGLSGGEVDLTNYYTKQATNDLLDVKADKADVYTKGEIDAISEDIVFKGALTDYYTAVQTDNLLSAKADKSNVYTKSEVDAKTRGIENVLGTKANVSDVYVKSEIDMRTHITPAMYGAKGDGVTDDTQAFLDAIASIPNGGTLYIPTGKYILNSSLDLSKPLHIIGEGAFFPQSWNDSADYTGTILLFQSTGGIIVNRSGTIIENLGIVGQGAEATTNGITINTDCVTNTPCICCNFKNLIIREWNNGVYAPNTTFKNVFENIVIWGANTGFEFAGSTNTSLTLINCWACWCNIYGYHFKTTEYSTLINCCADNNVCGYWLQSCKGMNLIGCGCENSTEHGFYMTWCEGIEMSGCFSHKNNKSYTKNVGTLATITNTKKINICNCYDTGDKASENYLPSENSINTIHMEATTQEYMITNNVLPNKAKVNDGSGYRYFTNMKPTYTEETE